MAAADQADGKTATPRGQRLTGRGILMLVSLVLAWGLFWPFMKMAVNEIPVLWFRVACCACGGVTLLSIARFSGHRLRPTDSDRTMLVLTSFVGISAWFYLSATGVSMMPPGRASTLAYTMPLWAFLLAWALLNEKPTAGRWFALVLGLGGVAVLGGEDIVQAGAAPVGIVIMLLAAFSWALHSVLLKRHQWETASFTVVGWQLLIGGIPILAAALIWELDDLQPVSSQAIFATFVAFLLSVVYGMWAWFRLMAMMPLAIASLTVLGVPVVGVLSSAIILGDVLGWREIIALVLVVGALATLQNWRNVARALTQR